MNALPRSLAGYILKFSGRHQLALCLLSVVVFALSAVPLELQRRIVNDAIDKGDWSVIAWLAAAYVGVALAEGGVKLLMNVYRSWVSENAVRHLRNLALSSADAPAAAESGMEGVELAMVLSEVEPVGGFIGSSTSEPVLQGGILAAVFGYMLYLEPVLAGLCLLVFSPQLVFVPLMQAAINRRVEKRVLTMRGISDGILGSGAADAQRRRVDDVFELHMGMFKLKYGMNFLMNLTHHTGVAAALAFGGWYVLRGHIELGTVVAFISGLAKVNDPWGDVVNWFRDLTVNLVKYRLIADALARMGAVDAGQSPLAAAA